MIPRFIRENAGPNGIAYVIFGVPAVLAIYAVLHLLGLLP